ncbi:PREDICTED: uncharacterized protein LOC107346697 [Acropora digitifera]|uniref:uncharacterized protein LOC107346697 n=1 Tax=Acropora digitifera TaxID=70779 RepID=UPI00077A6557|nr:PREDICTED: uncharacterized protein LOC107346697 [Acropora digitifera]
MASIVITTNQDLEDITLEANDIPGAELPNPPELCTLAILKRWLSCRGAKVSGKRHELIKRVNDYIEATTIQSVKFEKHILGKEKRERKASVEVTGKSEYHQQTKDDSEQLLRKVREVEQKTGKKIGLSFIMPHEVPKVVKAVDNGHSKNNC